MNERKTGADRFVGITVSLLMIVWTVVGTYRCVGERVGEFINKSATVNVNNDSSIEIFHVRNGSMDCMVAVHMFPKIPGTPSQMHMQCRD